MEPEDRMPPLSPGEPVERVDQVDRVEYVRPGERVSTTARYETLPPWYRTERIIYFILGIIETLLVIRLVLKLLAANPNAGFSNLIYGVTNPLVAPFQGVFPDAGAHSGVLELAALLAIIVYALLAWGIVKLVELPRRRRPTPTM
ncbi:MAG TPA: YggT family protein [Ktedonobacterales bacterium]|nr:YggT family protein [Ktedonobacterales bacterium]